MDEAPNPLRILFERLHEELVNRLLKEINEDEVTPAMLSCARQLLKDNNIDSVDKKGKLRALKDALPFDNDEPIEKAQ